jgi:hypothetical protein
MGRPPIGKVAMSAAERVRRYHAKHDEQLKAEATATDDRLHVHPDGASALGDGVEIRR